MGVSKVTLNGDTLMDITSDTVDATNLLTGFTAHGADGDSLTGAYTPITYENKAAESGGTELSLVTTGEKYIWNNKISCRVITQTDDIVI